MATYIDRIKQLTILIAEVDQAIAVLLQHRAGISQHLQEWQAKAKRWPESDRIAKEVYTAQRAYILLCDQLSDLQDRRLGLEMRMVVRPRNDKAPPKRGSEGAV